MNARLRTKSPLLVIAALAIVMLIAFIGRAPSLNRAEANYCEDLAAYGQAVVQLRTIDENSTVDQLKDAQKAIEKSWKDLQNSSQQLRQARLEVVEDSFNNLQFPIRNTKRLGNRFPCVVRQNGSITTQDRFQLDRIL